MSQDTREHGGWTAPHNCTGTPVVSLSGGRDSAAVGVWVAREYSAGRLPRPRYVTADVGRMMEPELIGWLNTYQSSVVAPLDLSVEVVDARNLGRNNTGYRDAWASVYERVGNRPVLPGPMFRTCTWRLKIEPIQRWRRGIEGPVTWIIGFRVDEGSEARRVQTARFADPNGRDSHWRPFVELGWGKAEVRALLAEAGVPEPSFYSWTTRSGCAFCFYKPARELAEAARRHPESFEHLAAHEEAVIASAGKRGASPWVTTRNGTLREIVTADRAQLRLFDRADWDDERRCDDPLGTCSL